MTIKKKVEDQIRLLLQLRIETAHKAMNEAQASANEEGKSTAGDKYETGRAMAQNQRDMNARQWAEARQLLETFEKATLGKSSNQIGVGNLVKTEGGLFYLGPGIGKMEMEELGTIWALSIQSPLGKLLLGKKPGDKLEWMGKTIHIQELW